MKLSLVPIFLFLLVDIAIVNCDGRRFTDIDYRGLKPCQTPVESNSSVKVTVGAEDKYTVHIELDQDVDGYQEYLAYIHMWDKETNDWAYRAYEFDGPMYHGVERYLPEAWDKLIAASDPPIEDKLYIPAGTYDMKEVSFTKKDVNVPSGMDGPYRIDFNMMMETDNVDELVPWFCFGLELSFSNGY